MTAGPLIFAPGGALDYQTSAQVAAAIDAETAALAAAGRFVVSVRDYGALGDGVTDDGAAFQAAVDTAILAGGSVFVPGTDDSYHFASTVTVSGAVKIYGVGLKSLITQAALSTTPFKVTTGDPVIFDDITIGNVFDPWQTSGAGIQWDTGSATLAYCSRVTNCTFVGQHIGIDFQRAAVWVVENCQFTECTNGIEIRDLANEDGGDNVITGCSFAQGLGVGETRRGIAINHISGGGLRLTENKVNGHAYGYVLNLDLLTVAGTSDLIIAANSFENLLTAAITLQQAGGNTDLFRNATIIGNQIAYVPTGIIIYQGSGSNWLTGFVIADNIIQSATGGAGISLNTGDRGAISGNVLTSEGGTATGILTGGGGRVTNVLVDADNVFAGYTTNVSLNGGAIRQPKIQRGSGSAATSGAFGNVFAGAGTGIVFDVAYAAAPKVVITPSTNVGNGISGYASAVSTTGFTPYVIGATNTATIAFDWVAYGDL